MAENQNNQEQPKYLTHEDLNGALAAQKKDFQKLMQQMQEQTKTLVETLQSTLGPTPEKQALPSKQELSEDTAELKKQIKLLMDRDKVREQTEKQMKMEKSLRDTLNKHGISSRSDLALKYLQDQVSYDEDGQLVMKFDEINYPLDQAVAKFSQTEHGKFLTDPKDIRGSGAIRNISPPNTSQNNTVSQMVTGMGGTPVFKDAKSLKNYVASELGKEQLKF